MKKRKKNFIFKAIWVISFIAYVIFLIYIFILDMIPTKYLTIIISITLMIYFLFMLFMFNKKIKKKIKVVSSLFLILFASGFGLGIKYLSDTVNFLDVIDNKLNQKSSYYVMVLEDSTFKKIDDLENKTIGVYSSIHSNEAIDILKKEIRISSEDYSDVEEMLYDLMDRKIDSVLINNSIKNLIDTEFSDLNIKLRNIKEVTISIEKEEIVKVVDITKKKFNVYIAGGDAYGSIDNVTNTDVNMVATIDPVNNKVLLTSIPRDYYVNLPGLGDNAYDKLTHAGYYGIEESVKAVENLLDIDINYYVKINFSTVVGVIDAIGGIDVESDYSFTTHNDAETRYYSYYVGNNHLSGEEALAFARERMSFQDGDVQRVKNQQKVISALVKKASSSTSIITNFSSILDSVKENFSTNIDTRSINKFVKKQLNELKGWSIESQNLVGTDMYTTDTYTFPGMNLYVMGQDQESVNECSEAIKQFLRG